MPGNFKHSPSVNDYELETKVLNILEEINASIDPGLVEDCHCLPSKRNSKKLILKLNLHEDAKKVLSNKKKNKKLGLRNSEPAFWYKILHKWKFVYML